MNEKGERKNKQRDMQKKKREAGAQTNRQTGGEEVGRCANTEEHPNLAQTCNYVVTGDRNYL